MLLASFLIIPPIFLHIHSSSMAPSGPMVGDRIGAIGNLSAGNLTVLIYDVATLDEKKKFCF